MQSDGQKLTARFVLILYILCKEYRKQYLITCMPIVVKSWVADAGQWELAKGVNGCRVY
jgi:hypothetical protein